MSDTKILIIGAGGQIGTVLSQKLIEIYGDSNVFATDLKPNPEKNIIGLDVLNKEALSQLISENKINEIYHLAAILSATGEKNPKWAWDVNMGGLFNVFEAAVEFNVNKVFYPSTIAVFGEEIPLQNTPNHIPLIPATVYGISKVAGELWASYFYNKYGLDVRSIRYPGVIGYQSLAGGGTTDYAVDIFHSNAKNEIYKCFLSEDTTLPMIFIDDCIRATIEIMQAPKDKIKVRTSYNIAGVSFSPKEIYESILIFSPDFKIDYQPDFRQQIAMSWPQSIDDTLARNDWGWKPNYNLHEMTKIMIQEVAKWYQTSNN